jgi:uncharacterized protein (TIGR03067 family)
VTHIVSVVALACPLLFLCGCDPKPANLTSGGLLTAATSASDLTGVWKVTAITAARKPVPAERVEEIGLTYQFDGGQLTIRRPDRPDSSSPYTTDLNAQPQRISIYQTPPVQGIYIVDGDVLKLCVTVGENPDAGFPTEFVSKSKPRSDLLTFQRVTDAALHGAAGSLPAVTATIPSSLRQ